MARAHRALLWLTIVLTASAWSYGQGVGAPFRDPANRYTIEVPTGWTVEANAGGARFHDPEGAIEAIVTVVAAETVEAGIAAAWRRMDPDAAWSATGAVRPPAPEGVEDALCINYSAPRDRVVLALGHLYRGRVYVFLLNAPLDAYVRRQAQIGILASSLAIVGIEREDLAAALVRPFDADLAGGTRAFVRSAMDRADVPGAVVAVVRDGETVYLEAFGVKERGRPDAIGTETQMMIGSTGKTLTTLMMASLVDDGRIAWSTPAASILPSFAMADATLSETLALRQLVCACTGVPRRDLELLFNARTLAAEEVVASLAEFEAFTASGEAFQYSNQMVAAGGYLAALADAGAGSGMLPAYARVLQERVLGPIGMRHTTLSFLAVMARGDHAAPHGLPLVGTRVPIPLADERFVLSVAPAGGHWSTAPDLARYLATLLAGGVAPSGERVVSEEGLETLWRPQVRISAGLDYGLGWMVGDWHGLRTLDHAGNTLGFTSSLVLVPEKDLGVVVLANGRSTNAFNEAVAYRILSRLLGRDVADVEEAFAFALETRAATRLDAWRRMRPGLDLEQVRPFLGRFWHPRLGPIDLSLEAGRLFVDTGEYRSELVRRVDHQGRIGYVAADAPMTGLLFELARDADGEPEVVLFSPPEDRRFVRR